MIKKLLYKICWRRKVCPNCVNLELVGNYSPCYSCECGSNFEKVEYKIVKEEAERKMAELKGE